MPHTGDKLIALMEKESEFCETYKNLPELKDGGIENTAKKQLAKGNKEMHITLGNYYVNKNQNAAAREQYNLALEAGVGEVKVIKRKIADSYSDSEWETARPAYEEAYNAGDVSAALVIGNKLKEIVDQKNLVDLADTDYDEARKWLNMALENKVNEAQASLQSIDKRYTDRDNYPGYKELMKKDYAGLWKVAQESENTSYYKVCAENGIAAAYVPYADILVSNYQRKEARTYYLKAAQAGDKSAGEKLLELDLYEDDFLVKNHKTIIPLVEKTGNYKKLVEYSYYLAEHIKGYKCASIIKKGVDKGDKYCKYKYGCCLLYGIGGATRDVPTALKMLNEVIFSEEFYVPERSDIIDEGKKYFCKKWGQAGKNLWETGKVTPGASFAMLKEFTNMPSIIGCEIYTRSGGVNWQDYNVKVNTFLGSYSYLISVRGGKITYVSRDY